MAASATTTFDGIYMRPNLNNSGTIPAGSPYCTSPDVWLAGTTPVTNYQTTLATSTSYASSSSSNIYSGQMNILYLRGKNGASSTKTVNASLYYAPSAIIQSPGTWQNNQLKTDTGYLSASISNLASGSIGVADRPFIWENPSNPPPGSDHWCFIAQFNDAQDSNPMPSVDTALDMSGLIMNNLGWGWRNTTLIDASAEWSYSEPLTIPSNYPTAYKYAIYIAPVGYVGWEAEFYATQDDSDGNPIKLARTKVTADGQLLGVGDLVLEPNFTTNIKVNMYAPTKGQQPSAGAKVPLSCNYVPTTTLDVREAVARGLVDWEFMARVRREVQFATVEPTIWLIQGAYTWQV